MNELENLEFKRDNGGISALMTGLGKFVAGICAVVAVLVTFTDITFGGFAAKDMTCALAVLLISAYIIYFSLEESGERRGEESAEFRSAYARHRELCSKLTPDMLPRLRGYLTEYTLDEATSRRRALLLQAGYSDEEYEAYKAGKRFKGTARRVMRRAAKIKVIRLSPGDILSGGKPKKRGELCNPEPRARLGILLKLLPTTVCMTITVSIMLTIKDSLDAADVCEGLMKLSTLPIIGVRGYISGFTYAKDVRAGWLETKARILEGFLPESGLTRTP